MAVEKPVSYDDGPVQQQAIDIEIQDPTQQNIRMMDDGSAVINEVPEQPQMDFGSNLAEFMSDDDMNVIANELIGKFDEDKSSRKDWE